VQVEGHWLSRARTLTFVVVAILIAFSSDAPPHWSGLERGALLYASNCVSCHGGLNEFAALPGIPVHGPSGHTWGHPDSALIKLIIDGRAGLPRPGATLTMPAFGNRLSPDQVSSIVLFIKSSWTDEQHELRERWFGCRQFTTTYC